jgi:hypothetical protein
MSGMADVIRELPEDLRAWVEPEFLLRYVLEAVQSAAEHPAPGEGSLPAGLPRTWLTVLTYGYAIGLNSSDDIELESRADAQLAYAASNACVSASALRHFRRSHRSSLRFALGLVLSRVWHVRNSSGFEDGPSQHEIFEITAERRINNAVLADTMALDT